MIQSPTVSVHSAHGIHNVNTVKEEVIALLNIGFPTALTLLCRTGMGMTDLAFLGHLKSDYLAAASLSLVWMTITSVVISRGVNTSLTTLASQAYGSKHDHLCGIWLQIALITSFLCFIPLALLWYFFDEILILFHVDHKFARLAAEFARYSIIGLFPNQLYFNLSAYFKAQGIVYPFLIVAAIFLGVNIALNYILIKGCFGWDGLGFIGSPIATSCSRWGQLILLMFYALIYKKLHKSTWNGWDYKQYTFTRLREFARMGVANTIAAGLEEYQIELVAIFAMKLGKDQLATHNSMLQLFFLCTSAMYGISTATNVRVGQCLGAGNIKGSKLVLRVACFNLSLPVGIVVGAFFVLGRNVVGKIFSPDQHIQHLAASISWLVGPSYFMLCFFYTAMACLDAQGRPQVVALSFLIGAWGICIPTAYLLTFKANLGLQGLWLGLICGYAVITFIVVFAVFKSDWVQIAKDAIERSQKTPSFIDRNSDTTRLLQSPVDSQHRKKNSHITFTFPIVVSDDDDIE